MRGDENLILGTIAVQLGFLDRDELNKAMEQWGSSMSRSLADVLIDRGAIDAADLEAIQQLVQIHINRHDTSVIGAEESIERDGQELGDRTTTLVRENISSLDPDLSEAGDLTFSAPSRLTTKLIQAVRSTSEPSPPSRYSIIRHHASGGIGQVSVARDRELNRDVALKELQGRFADAEGRRARFLFEGEITGQLEHPGIVPVYGMGIYPDGRPYYAMRFIQGQSLSEAIAAYHHSITIGSKTSEPAHQSIGLRKLLARFLDLCNTVNYAHDQGVVHRDIKPSNVMLGKYGETLLVDWGLAKRVGDPSLESESGNDSLDPLSPSLLGSGSALTLPGSAHGTPAYMSPEQAMGDLDLIGPTSDIYSLGASLYEILTGRVPFNDQTAAEVIKNVKAGQFEPPSLVNRHVPKALEAICLKAMALDQSDRYRTAKDLGSEIEYWLADEPVQAFREPMLVRLRRWGRRHRTIVTSVVASATVALVAIGFFGHQRRMAAVQRIANAKGMVKAIETADSDHLTVLLDSTDELELVLDYARVRINEDDRLRSFEQNDPKNPQLDSMARTNLLLALGATEATDRNELINLALSPETPPDFLGVIRDRLSDYGDELSPRIWKVLEGVDGSLAPDRRLRAAALLAICDPPKNPTNRDRWERYSKLIIEQIVRATEGNTDELEHWQTLFKPAREPLFDALRDRYRIGQFLNLMKGTETELDYLDRLVGSDIEPLLVSQLELVVDRYRNGVDEQGLPGRATVKSLLLEYGEGPDQWLSLVKAADASDFELFLAKLRETPEPAVQLMEQSLHQTTIERETERFPESTRRSLQARQLGRVAASLIQLEEPQKVWEQLRFTEDPSLRTEIIHAIPELGDPEIALRVLLRRIEELVAVDPSERNSSEHSTLFALLQCLGEFPEDLYANSLPNQRHIEITDNLTQLYLSDPDPGIHGALNWLLRNKWGRSPREQADFKAMIERLDQIPEVTGLSTERGWFVGPAGQTFSIIDGPVEFKMGSPAGEFARMGNESEQLIVGIEHSFGISTKEVTAERYREFLSEYDRIEPPAAMTRYSQEPGCPALGVSWYEAAAFCRWLGDREGLEEDQQCYPSVDELLDAGEGLAELEIPSDFLERTGYRLPTEAEWEYACRAGTTTSRSFGEVVDRLRYYGWYAEVSENRTHPVGQLKPNDFGLFDMYGNVFEWTLNLPDSFPANDEPLTDLAGSVESDQARSLRGGSFIYLSENLRSAYRYEFRPTTQFYTLGFRVARTLPNDPGVLEPNIDSEPKE